MHGRRTVTKLPAASNGAKALGIDDATGSIILIRGNDIDIAPIASIGTSVLQSATPAG